MESNQACAVLSRLNQSLYAEACFAENWGLQGQTKKSRDTLLRLISGDGVAEEQRAWLLTTLAELEARCRQYPAADKSYRTALRLSPRDAYLAVSYADFLLSRGRAPEVISLLKDFARSDAVLLRLTRARQELKAPGAASDREALTQRMNLEKLSEQERIGHAREHAMFALWIQKDSNRALEFARLNVTVQREPIDLLLFAQAARASKQGGAAKEVVQLKKDMGLFDERIDELL
jgi:predicted Zn-dependent protease